MYRTFGPMHRNSDPCTGIKPEAMVPWHAIMVLQHAAIMLWHVIMVL